MDLSEDLVQGSLAIRSNALHTFQFQLQNAQRKYDGMIRPMDKIVVTMTRIGAPARVFSGYMNNGPVFSVWPRVLSLSATCTLKRLAYWSWDSTSTAASTLLSQWNNTNATGASGTPTTGGQVSVTDGGLRDLVIDLLSTVCNWPKGQIHVGSIPPGWFQFAQAIGDEITAAADETSLIGSLAGTTGASSSVGGQSITSGAQLPAGTYGGQALNAEQATNASIIFAVAASLKLTAHDASMGIGCSMQEASLINLDHGDRDSVGLFQQRPSQGWGTKAQCMDPTYAATQFFNHLVKVPNYETLPYTQAIQAVQRSGFPDAYAKWQTMSDAVVAKLQSLNQNSSNAQSITNTTPSGSSGIGMAAPAGATGRNVAAYGYNLITSRASNPIHYTLGGDSPDTTSAAQVQSLDCSSFVQWSYYHASNTHLVRTAAQQQAACTHTLPGNVAQFIKGAVVWPDSGHIELSLGNGYTAAAHSSSFPLGEFGQCQVSIAYNQFPYGGLLPGIDYTDAATTQAAADALTALTGTPHTVSNPSEFPGDGSGTSTPGTAGTPGSSTGDTAASVFNALINVYTWGYVPSVEGQVLAGPRALMNDDPILPFVANLMQASMRSWCSAPNGDFAAWFPDYFDIWNYAGKMVIQPIELMDFTVDWADTDIVTHQYVIGSIPGMGTVVDNGSGNLVPTNNGGLLLELDSQGIATMDFPQIFRAIFGQDATQDFLDEYLNRFGARPNIQQVPSIQQGRPEFFMALYLFMQHWANQFTATVPMTFMPELWPGMIMQIPAFSFQCYVMNVYHTFSYGPNGSFNTSADVCAPARIGDTDKMSVFGMLPVGGQSYLGTQPGVLPTNNPTTTGPSLGIGHGMQSPLLNN